MPKCPQRPLRAALDINEILKMLHIAENSTARTGRYRRIAGVAEGGLERLNWAERAPSGVASGRTEFA